jgi:hypothetical protein
MILSKRISTKDNSTMKIKERPLQISESFMVLVEVPKILTNIEAANLEITTETRTLSKMTLNRETLTK